MRQISRVSNPEICPWRGWGGCLHIGDPELRRRSANTRAAAGQSRRPGGEKGSQCGGRQTNDTVIELIIPTGRCLQYCPLSGNTEIHWEHGHRHHQPHCPPHSLPHHSRAGCILIWPKGKIKPPKLLKLNQVDLNIAIFENLFAERSHKQLRAFTNNRGATS